MRIAVEVTFGVNMSEKEGVWVTCPRCGYTWYTKRWMYYTCPNCLSLTQKW